MIKNFLLKKCISKLLFQKNVALSNKCIFKKHSKIAPSKNVFQKHMSNWPLKIAPSKKCISKLL